MSCKVYLVPEDVINSWRSEQREAAVDKPLDKTISKLDSDMNKTLNTNMSDYDKEKIFTQQLNQYLTMRDQKYEAPHETLPTAHVLSSIPKIYQSKARGLLEFLKADKDVQWDEQGRLSIGEQRIENSHIIDLIHDALRHRKRAEKPKGWRELSKHLHSKNIPHELVGNPQWHDTPRQQKPKPKTLDERFTPVKDFEEYTPNTYETPKAAPRLKQRKSKILGRKKIKDWIHVKP